MTDLSFKRTLAVTDSTFTTEISPGYVTENTDHIYLPLTFDGFTADTVEVDNIDFAVSATTLQGAAGDFDTVRVGDVITSTTSGSFTAPTPVALTDIYTINGKSFVVYPDTYTEGTLGVQAGDLIEGTGIPATTYVDRIDYSTNTIYITNACTATAIQADVTYTPLIRVTAVRTSTAVGNANQIDFDSDAATEGTDATVTITPGAREAVFAVLRITPVDNSTGSRVIMDVRVGLVDGALVKGAPNGLNDIDVTSLTYSGLNTFSFNGDAFLIDAGVASPVS